MTYIQTKAIVLSRTNYGEADRIMNILTPDDGKLSVIAKGVRRERSKLAGGVELLAVTDLTLHLGKGNLAIVTSARLEVFFSHILQEYERLQFAYYALKDVGKAAEMAPEPEFYELLETCLRSLHTLSVSLAVTEVWYRLQMAIQLGVGLNLATDNHGQKLQQGKTYFFDIADMACVEDPRGHITAEHIKVLRLASAQSPEVVQRVEGITTLLPECLRIATIAHE